MSRADRVEQARNEWIKRLIDHSRRNNLLYFRELKLGNLVLTGVTQAQIHSLLKGETVSVLDLMDKDVEGRDELERREEREALEQNVTAKLKGIRGKAVENLEERGLDTLNLAIGFATWPSQDGERPPEAPVLLVPIELKQRGGSRDQFLIRRTGEAHINPVLLHVLEEILRVQISSDEILTSSEDDEDIDLKRVFSRLGAIASGIQDFRIEEKCVIGNFSFAKMAMVQDLKTNAEILQAHDIIAAVAGDPGARSAVRPAGPDPDPREFDHTPPAGELLVLDADSSQQQVIAQLVRGCNGVIQGPPGTGKSQTIANAIATLVVREKPVLFVAEKRAALEVVQRRLNNVGLGGLVLDLHGADVSRKQVMSRIKEALQNLQTALPVDAEACHRELAKQRGHLSAHLERLHTPRQPSGLTVFQLQGEILRAPEPARVAARWRGASLDEISRERGERIEDLLREAAGVERLFLRDDPSPWTGATIKNAQDAQEALGLAHEIVTEIWPAYSAILTSAASQTGLPMPTKLSEAKESVRLLLDVTRTTSLYKQELYAKDLGALESALAPAGRSKLAASWAFVSDGMYRAARRELMSLRRAKAPTVVLLEEAHRALDEQKRWRQLGGERLPVPVGAPSDLEGAHERLVNAVDRLSQILGRDDLDSIPLEALSRLFGALAADTATPLRLPRLWEIETELTGLGIGNLIAEIRQKKIPESFWVPAFRFAWYSSCLDKARLEDPHIAGFNGRRHDQIVEGFKTRDQELLSLAAKRIRRMHAEHVIEVMNAHPDQQDLVRAEALKRSRHMPLRKLLAKAPDVMTALFPCWLASPLSVSQLLGADRRYFEYVLFDEASQIQPEDAIPSLMRASKVVVAGDRHQLPPTAFFADGGPAANGDDEADEIATAGFESLLDVMDSFLPAWMLEWHYRSRDETLIAFSNRHIYSDRLITFPGTGGSPAVSHVLVDLPEGIDGQEESAAAEVNRVVELVIRHAEERPEETLGVITLGIKHARRIEMALDRMLALRPDLEEFFDQQQSERFFVKNIERVQGDERDAIILSIGAGRNRGGTVSYRAFGPINHEGGERRLNVAVTRARKRMTVVSSFTHHDMDPRRSTRRGVEFLRNYLRFAASDGKLLGDEGETPVPLNSFEADVADMLRRHRMPLIPQYGCSSYRIDLVAQHPKKPGRLVLAIECDGATYHSSPTARDRDRLRQQILERLGWRFHRIWSTDWFMDREGEIKRALQAYQEAVAYADWMDSKPTSSRPKENEGRVTVASPDPPSEPARGKRPNIPSRPNITDYSNGELDRLLKWILSDGKLRTDEQIIDEMMRELGYSRRGRRIVAAIRNSIKRVRNAKRGKRDHRRRQRSSQQIDF